MDNYFCTWGTDGDSYFLFYVFISQYSKIPKTNKGTLSIDKALTKKEALD